MSTTEWARTGLAPAIARVLLKHAFGDDAAVIGGTAAEWLNKRFVKGNEAQAAQRIARSVADRIVTDLAPLFAGANSEAVTLALGKALDRHVDGRFLVRHGLDPERATQAFLDLCLPELSAQAYGDAEIRLHGRVIPALMRRLVRDAKHLPDFEVASAAEVLRRLQSIGDTQHELRAAAVQLDEVRAVWEQRRGEAWHRFEHHYAEAVLDRWNKLELFGIDVTDEVQRRQQLSVAYLPLNLQSGQNSGIVSFEELLAGAARSGEPLIILGAAGSGKTTLLRWAACHAVRWATDLSGSFPFEGRRDQWPVLLPTDRAKRKDIQHLAWWVRAPFLLRMREVRDGVLPRELDWPRKTTGSPRDPPPGWLNQILEAGHGLVLVDGLDELGIEGREVARDTLRAILRDQRGNLIVVTSRPGAFDKAWFEGVNYQLATIRTMAPAQREACITSWHEAVAQAKPREQEVIRELARDLISKLRRTPHLQEPTTTPLICVATCALHYGRAGYLPTGLVKLFDALIDMIIHERERQELAQQQAHVPVAYRTLDLGAKRQLLEQIAAEMILCHQSERTRADTLTCIQEKLQSLPDHRTAKAENILDGLLLRSGLLRPSGNDAVDFLHNAFKEYLAAARFLARGSHPYLIEEADRDPGERVFFYAYAIASNRGDETLSASLVEGLLDKKAPARKVRRRRQVLALRCRSVTVSARPEILARFDRVIAEILPPQDPTEAEVAAALGEGIVPRLVQPLAAASIQAACARALAMIGNAQALTALRRYAATDKRTVAQELAFAVHPLTISYWLSAVAAEAKEWRRKPALPDTIAREIKDLEPLRNLATVSALDLRGTAITDVVPLADLPGLRELNLCGTAITDIAPLAGLTSLRELDLTNTAITDLAPLGGLTKLETLRLTGTAVANLAPLAGLTAR